jgi:ElaB/YqjD/DUF883 family membrane-anchored ribosome-binding protein
MACTPEVIRQQMGDTRAALTEKLQSLECRVEQTVEEVKETVDDTIGAVKQTFDLPFQVERHPWAMVGGAAALGFVLGEALSLAARKSRHSSLERGWSNDEFLVQERAKEEKAKIEGNGHTNVAAIVPKTERPSLLQRISTEFGDEIDKIKGMAIGAGFGLIREGLTRSCSPEMRSQVENVIDSITVKLGGEPMHGPILSSGAGTSKVSHACEKAGMKMHSDQPVSGGFPDAKL